MIRITTTRSEMIPTTYLPGPRLCWMARTGGAPELFGTVRHDALQPRA
jgi:hypothetical protein